MRSLLSANIPSIALSSSKVALGLCLLLSLQACSDEDSGGDENNAGSGGSTASGGLGGNGAATGGANSGGENPQGNGSESGGQSASGGASTGGQTPVDDPALKSSGCGSSSGHTTETWLPQNLGERYYELQLPADYDSEIAYPVVYQFHGCNSNEKRETNNVPVVASSGDTAIVVRGRALGNCWSRDDDDDYTNAMIDDVEGRFCIDTSRRFLSGYSSGAFYSHQLTCSPEGAARFRGVATIAGGGGGRCEGKVASLLIHDQSDPTVAFTNGETARDRYVTQNACDESTPAAAVDPAPCVAYQSCTEELPVVWCATDGEQHSRQDAFSGPASWNFFKSLL